MAKPGGSSSTPAGQSRGKSSSAKQTTKVGKRKAKLTRTRPARPTAHDINQRSALDALTRFANHVKLLPDGDIGSEIEAYSLFDSPTPTVLSARENIIRSITDALNNSPLTRQSKSYTVIAFGSTTFGLDSNASDLDLCILDPYLPQGPRTASDIVIKGVYNMKTLAKMLHLLHFTHIYPIQNATVPIVKFKCPHGLISGDLNTNHTLGFHNSILLKAYHNIAPQLFRPLGMGIKLWAKTRGICDPSGATGLTSASSYSLILMLVGYLQAVGQLPNLQDKRVIDQASDNSVFTLSKSSNGVKAEEHNTSFRSQPPLGWAPKDDVSLAKLFVEFFKYYASFDFTRLVVSIRNGNPCERHNIDKSNSFEVSEDESSVVSTSEDRKMKRKQSNNRSNTPIPPGAPPYYSWDEPMAVEDPFIQTRNTCKNIKPSMAKRMKAEFARAQQILEAGGGLLKLCKMSKKTDVYKGKAPVTALNETVDCPWESSVSSKAPAPSNTVPTKTNKQARNSEEIGGSRTIKTSAPTKTLKRAVERVRQSKPNGGVQIKSSLKVKSTESKTITSTRAKSKPQTVSTSVRLQVNPKPLPKVDRLPKPQADPTSLNSNSKAIHPTPKPKNDPVTKKMNKQKAKLKAERKAQKKAQRKLKEKTERESKAAQLSED
ncbi:hypothetical protein CROQUDRAFT_549572 [Cronartium quercuum f. sp. fusiforme G11]|uniref:polynucleotide adenylyltransferase n=1 Tax=Cronartium quercuum f. sp. fusiforme G11 TaxID=708437 RepID=A0A9P6TB39_9BASI|nr:hypothetical protein CROQUDRAFT_549572 [Cronartium quercuum f. sp. fusiforme G11]